MNLSALIVREIPPELRENRGELDLGLFHVLDGELPDGLGLDDPHQHDGRVGQDDVDGLTGAELGGRGGHGWPPFAASRSSWTDLAETCPNSLSS